MKKNFKQGFVLLSTLFIALFLSILLSAAFISSEMQFKSAIQRISAQTAFYTAESGIQRAIFELRRNPIWGFAEGEAGNPILEDIDLTTEEGSILGSYTITITDGGELNGWQTRWINAEGQDQEQSIRKILKARVRIENPARFLVSTLGTLRIGSGASIEADSLAKDMFFDVNESLPEEQRGIFVDGDIFYIRSITGDDHVAVTITGETLKTPSITFPGVDLDYYRDLLNDSLVDANEGFLAEGDLVVDLGNLTALISDPPDPYVPQLIMAEGDIYLSGTYDHSLLVVAGGHVYLNGNILPDDSVPIRPQIGIFAKKDVLIPEDALETGEDMAIEAFILADGDADDAQGIFLAEAAKGSLGTLNFTGAISTRGKGRTAVDLNAFTTRNYTFNPELNSNRTIPFSPFIVNMVEWIDATFLAS